MSSNSFEPFYSLISGVSAGLVCTVICAPLDVAKIRQQVQGSLHLQKYSGSIQTFQSIFQQEGLRGFYRGMGTALINIPLFWGIYWYGYEKLKFYFETESNFILPIQHILSATIAGGIADIVTNPFWVVRTRIQTLIMHPERHFDTSVPSTLTMFRTIYEQEGFRAFYRGLSASFLGLPHVAIQFPLYEYLKQFSCQQRGKQESSAIDHFFASIIAKSIACSITYPHEVLRARMQDTTHRLTSSMTSSRSLIASSSLVMLTKKIIHEEGIKALWSGFRISMIRVIPSTTSSFITYEYITKLLRARRE